MSYTPSAANWHVQNPSYAAGSSRSQSHEIFSPPTFATLSGSHPHARQSRPRFLLDTMAFRFSQVAGSSYRAVSRTASSLICNSSSSIGPIRSRLSAAHSHALPSSSLLRSTLVFNKTQTRFHGHLHKPKPGEELHVTFITKDGEQFSYEVAEGDNLLDIAQAHGLDMEGACGGSCACSTCHIIVDPDFYDVMEEPDDDENDMLDLAFGLTETSRLGCQIKMTKDLDGLRVALPAMTRNLQARDFEKR